MDFGDIHLPQPGREPCIGSLEPGCSQANALALFEQLLGQNKKLRRDCDKIISRLDRDESRSTNIVFSPTTETGSRGPCPRCADMSGELKELKKELRAAEKRAKKAEKEIEKPEKAKSEESEKLRKKLEKQDEKMKECAVMLERAEQTIKQLKKEKAELQETERPDPSELQSMLDSMAFGAGSGGSSSELAEENAELRAKIEELEEQLKQREDELCVAQESASGEALKELEAQRNGYKKASDMLRQQLEAANKETQEANDELEACQAKYRKAEADCEKAVRRLIEQREALGITLPTESSSSELLPEPEPEPESSDDIDAEINVLLKEQENFEGGIGASFAQAKKTMIDTLAEISASARNLPGNFGDLIERLAEAKQVIQQMSKEELESQARFFPQRASTLFDILDEETKSSTELQEQLCKAIENARTQIKSALMRYLELRFTNICRGFNPDF